MDSILTDTLNTINNLAGRNEKLEKQIDYLQVENAKLQEANANLSAYCNYLCSLLASSPDPDTVPTVFEDEEQPSKRLREESSNEQLVFRTFESSPFIGNSDGFASYEGTNSLLEENQYDENDGFLVRNLFEENPFEEGTFGESFLGESFGESFLGGSF